MRNNRNKHHLTALAASLVALLLVVGCPETQPNEAQRALWGPLKPAGVNDILARLTGAESDVADLQSDVGTLQANVGTLQTDVAALQLGTLSDKGETSSFTDDTSRFIQVTFPSGSAAVTWTCSHCTTSSMIICHQVSTGLPSAVGQGTDYQSGTAVLRRSSATGTLTVRCVKLK